MNETKYIFFTGGVCSSLGKGVSVASLGCLLESRGFSVSIQKMDPYINIDPGTMSPYQHGEVYVTKDGAETDLDLGYYERFTNASFSKDNSVTAGQIYNEVIQRERKGDYLGKTVQVIPHITDEIKSRIYKVAKKDKPDFLIVEIGGTVGDIESVPFLEAIRQIHNESNKSQVLFVHLTLVPVIQVAGEAKTKPTQHSVKELLQFGIQPDILLCRVNQVLDKEMKSKISLFCNVDLDSVISASDIRHSIYEIPKMYQSEGFDRVVLEKCSMQIQKEDFSKWSKMVDILVHSPNIVNIAIVGKYISLQDAYRSIYESLAHGGIYNNTKVNFIKINSEVIEQNVDKSFEILEKADGILVPGGFGDRGIEGKILAIQFAREKKYFHFFGICLGMQCAVIEYARNVLKLEDSCSIEFDLNTKNPVISLIEDQEYIEKIGGTMRLGAYPCILIEGTKAFFQYEKKEILERHRHRFEFNFDYFDLFQKAGMVFSGLSPNNRLVEIIELPNHPWFIGVQFHPEFQSKPTLAHPLFSGFIRESILYKEKKMKEIISSRSFLDTHIGGKNPLFLIAGPCVIESKELLEEVCEKMQEICSNLGIFYVFKSSFDKANRSSIHSFRGVGLKKGIKLLEYIKSKYNVPILTDVHETVQVSALRDIVDIYQIPAFLCRQTDLIVEVAKTDRWINVKKGQFLSPHDCLQIKKKIMEVGSNKYLITERGTSFGYGNLVFDPRSIPIIHDFDIPFIFDATHSAQLPGKNETSTGGLRQYIPYTLTSAVSLGLEGIFMEVHPNPDQAKSDSATQYPLGDVEKLLQKMVKLDFFVKNQII